MKYKTELHCHSRDGSGCSNESAEGIVKKYLEHGYSTVVLTNHFDPAWNPDDREWWMEQIENKFSAYDKLVEAAEGKLNILMGMECRFVENNNDYVILGITREFLETIDVNITKSIRTFAEKAHEAGMFIIQAHPFRPHMAMMRPDHVDAIEVYNGHLDHDNHNFLAEAFAEHYGKIKTSGTDHHDRDHMPRGGIMTDDPITSIPQLIEVLKSGNYELIKTPPID
ncbi:MAG: hypothetical protein E7627_08915 [Ruminococcaceae bacterium]|nr:hypothetical protein [Oscillospiraceae bacterium]